MGNEEEYAARLGAKGLRAVRVARDGNCSSRAPNVVESRRARRLYSSGPGVRPHATPPAGCPPAANALAAGDAASPSTWTACCRALHGGGGSSDTTRLMRDGLTKVIQGGGQLGTALSRQVYVQTMATDGVLPERAELEQLAHVLGAPIYVYYYVPRRRRHRPPARACPSSELAPVEKIVLAPGAPTLGNATVRACCPSTSLTSTSASTLPTSTSTPPPLPPPPPHPLHLHLLCHLHLHLLTFLSPPPHRARTSSRSVSSPSRSAPLDLLLPAPPPTAADGRAAAAAVDDRLSPRPSPDASRELPLRSAAS